jgi:hypothetical protein
MILCIDCKHYKRVSTDTRDDLCMANAEIDLVRGELYSSVKCMSERDPRARCRPQGLNFVPLKESKPLTKVRKV